MVGGLAGPACKPAGADAEDPPAEEAEAVEEPEAKAYEPEAEARAFGPLEAEALALGPEAEAKALGPVAEASASADLVRGRTVVELLAESFVNAPVITPTAVKAVAANMLFGYFGAQL